MYYCSLVYCYATKIAFIILCYTFVVYSLTTSTSKTIKSNEDANLINLTTYLPLGGIFQSWWSQGSFWGKHHLSKQGFKVGGWVVIF